MFSYVCVFIVLLFCVVCFFWVFFTFVAFFSFSTLVLLVGSFDLLHSVRITWKPEYAGPLTCYDGPLTIRKIPGTEGPPSAPSLLCKRDDHDLV